MFFGEIFLRILVLFIFLLIKLVLKPQGARKRSVLFFIPLFMNSKIRDPVLFYPPGSGFGMKNLGIRIQDKTSRIYNTEQYCGSESDRIRKNIVYVRWVAATHHTKLPMARDVCKYVYYTGTVSTADM
jgi:hypothetical protein